VRAGYLFALVEGTRAPSGLTFAFFAIGWTVAVTITTVAVAFSAIVTVAVAFSAMVTIVFFAMTVAVNRFTDSDAADGRNFDRDALSLRLSRNQ
jgi:hypothetical protein